MDMIHTEVNKVGDHEHEVRARLPQAEYQRIYREKLGEMRHKARLPGFRAGKTPVAVLEKQFGGELHQQVAEELIRTHYAKVIENSGLEPAVQPEMSLSPTAPKADFEFALKVTTWPVITSDFATLKVEKLELQVEDVDIQGVVDRMMKNNNRFVADDARAAQEDDEITIDFSGAIDGVAFDGGTGEDAKLVLGEGRFIPGFEAQLVGAKAGDAVTVNVTFPEDYQAEHLAGQAAVFAITVHQVAAPQPFADEEALAQQVGFDDAEMMRASVRLRLESEAERLMLEEWRRAVVVTVLAGQDVSLPEALVQEEIRARVQSLRQDMQRQGAPIDASFFNDEMKGRVRVRSEEALRESVVVRALIEAGAVEVDDAELHREITKITQDYPKAERAEVLAKVRADRAQQEQVRSALIDRKAVEYALSQMEVTTQLEGLSAWQDAQEAREVKARDTAKVAVAEDDAAVEVDAVNEVSVAEA
ncbi:MAG: trigger factor [Mariprofundales bacterium]|nr:trigger factor [Mariprofundales bacterium]